MKSIIRKLDERFAADGAPAIDVPNNISFHEFMETCAKVRVGNRFVQYTTKGRQPLAVVIAIIDYCLGNDISYMPEAQRLAIFGTLEYGRIIEDAHIYVCGGAQFGKTVLALHLKAYLAAVKWYHSYYVLPDNDLVQAIIDGKERPEVLDQIGWLNEMVQIGKALNESGKTVNRKGVMLYTDGEHVAMSYMRGMNKIPTSISADAVIQDETDDVPPDKSKFLAGRMTASALRLFVAIGTQRYHGAGQNKLLEDGSKHLGWLTCPECAKRVNPEDEWPKVARMALDGTPAVTDPQLTNEGDFKRGSHHVAAFDHDAHYYLACTDCGAELDQEAIDYQPEEPTRIKARRWSVRVSQMCCSALPVKMFVADWCQNAVRDPDSMIAFNCDRLAKPRSTMQALTPAVIERARSLEPFSLSLQPEPDVLRYGGMDTGDRCWFVCREIVSDSVKRIRWAEQLSTESVRRRIPLLFHTLGLTALFIDIGAERSLVRDLCQILNEVVGWKPPRISDPEKAYIQFTRRLAWDGPNQRWKGLKCAAVEFSLKPGAGIRHKLGKDQEGRLYPVIQCNRDESMQHVVNEFLTADEGLVEVIDGKLRTEPTIRLPQNGPGAASIIQMVEDHHIRGSRKVKDTKGVAHFDDKLENHLMLANAYGRLAERVEGGNRLAAFAYEAVNDHHPGELREGVLV